jgi:hypothetical protein
LRIEVAKPRLKVIHIAPWRIAGPLKGSVIRLAKTPVGVFAFTKHGPNMVSWTLERSQRVVSGELDPLVGHSLLNIHTSPSLRANILDKASELPHKRGTRTFGNMNEAEYL